MGDTAACLTVPDVKILHTQQILKDDGAYLHAP